MSDIKITVAAGDEEVTARLTGWHGEALDAYHIAKIHGVVDRALTVLRVSPEPKPAMADALDR